MDKSEKKRKGVVRIGLVVVTVVGTVYLTPWTTLKARMTPMAETIEAQVQSGVDLGLDSMILHVHKTGEAPVTYAAGWKDKNKKIPADPQALFKIASMSKLYIASGFVKMVGEGKLSLDDTLAHHLPELVGKIEYAEAITLRQMVQHRSGIQNFTRGSFDWLAPSQDMDKNLARVFGKRASFQPNAGYSYSNTNYLLLGRIMDKVLGYDHQQYIKAEILTPLGITQTYGTMNDVDAADVISGYYFGSDKDLRDVNYTTPGGSMIAAIEDVGVFMRALREGTFFTEEEQKIYAGLYPYDHGGMLPGYLSTGAYYEDIDTYVILFANTSKDQAWSLYSITKERILRHLRGRTKG